MRTSKEYPKAQKERSKGEDVTGLPTGGMRGQG